MDKYYTIRGSHLSRIDNLVMNFEKMEFERRCFEKYSVKPFTNFTVSEILKPEFRSNVGINCSSVYDSDSDDTQSTGSLEHYSTQGDTQDCQNECQVCIRKECDPWSPEYYRLSSDEYRQSPDHYRLSPDEYQLSQSPDNTEHFPNRGIPLRRSYADSSLSTFRSMIAGDVSSDSSDNEAPLDLRIARKKTPPKMTGTLPAWVYCTRYSDRPTAGPRSRKPRRKSKISDKRNRTAFNARQIQRLVTEFELNPYLSETRRLRLSEELGLSEVSLKIWFQNQRAKTKKDQIPNPLAVRLAEDGLYNHKAIAER